MCGVWYVHMMCVVYMWCMTCLVCMWYGVCVCGVWIDLMTYTRCLLLVDSFIFNYLIILGNKLLN